MIFPKAKKIAKELKWHKTKSGVFGLYKEYFFQVGDSGLLSSLQYKYVVATTDPLSDEQIKQIYSELEANKKKLKFTTYEFGDKGILFQFAEIFTYTKLETVYSLLDFLVELFKKIGISEQSKCHNCGTKENTNYYEMNDAGTILCNSCFSEIEKNYFEVEQNNTFEEKNYFIGFLGSVAFSIPGIIIWILVAVYLDRLASAIAIVIAYLGVKGYQYFNGRYGKLTRYIIVISNIACIIIANIATIITLLINDGLTFSQSLYELQSNEVVKDLLFRNVMISLVLAFLVWIWLFSQFKYEKLNIKLAEKFAE